MEVLSNFADSCFHYADRSRMEKEGRKEGEKETRCLFKVTRPPIDQPREQTAVWALMCPRRSKRFDGLGLKEINW